jgi:hypothetical protein
MSRCGFAVSALRWLALVAGLALHAGGAMAVNKCVVNGQTIYQDAPCPGKAGAAAPVKIWSNTPGERATSSGNERWAFQRNADDMTGKVSCLASSPTVLGKWRGDMDSITLVRLAVSADQGGEIIGVVSTRDSFHNDLQGMGVKVDGGPFVPLVIKGSSKVVTFGPAEQKQMVQALASGKDVRLRLRFWPYDELHDTLPITTAGYTQALAQARRCAGRTDPQ